LTAYEVVLADLRAKRDQIDQAIAAIEALADVGSSRTISTPKPQIAENDAIRSGMFLGLTISDAVRRLLEFRKKPLTTKQIVDDIRTGGVHITSSNPINVVALSGAPGP
jgi:hypothetical protein